MSVQNAARYVEKYGTARRLTTLRLVQRELGCRENISSPGWDDLRMIGVELEESVAGEEPRITISWDEGGVVGVRISPPDLRIPHECLSRAGKRFQARADKKKYKRASK